MSQWLTQKEPVRFTNKLIKINFVNACDELAVHLSMLYSAMLIHRYFRLVTARCTIMPIPKGKNVNVTTSQNYRGISMCSVFAKLYDLTFLEKFSELLVTSDLQFGFKGIIPPPCAPWSLKKHSRTTLLTMGLRFVPFRMLRKHSIVLIFVNFFVSC